MNILCLHTHVSCAHILHTISCDQLSCELPARPQWLHESSGKLSLSGGPTVIVQEMEVVEGVRHRLSIGSGAPALKGLITDN